MADRRARQAIAGGAPLSVVYPGVIYGPGSLTEGNIVVRHLLDLAHGKLPGLLGCPSGAGTTSSSMTSRRGSSASSSAVWPGAALGGAAERDPGARWVLGGDVVTSGASTTWWSRWATSASRAGASPTCWRAAPASRCASWARWTGGTPQLTPDLVEIYRHDWALDSSRAAAGLGWRGRSLERA